MAPLALVIAHARGLRTKRAGRPHRRCAVNVRARRSSASTARAPSSRSAKRSRKNFRRSKKAVRVTVGISGTGGGFQKFCRAEIDISDASRPISATRSRGLQEVGRRIHRAAGRLRRHRHRGEPEGGVGRQDHRRRAEDALGARTRRARSPSGARSARAGRIARFTCSAPASTRAPTITSPKRSTARPRPAAATSPRAKTTTCWCRASATTSSRSASCPSPTSKATRTS